METQPEKENQSTSADSEVMSLLRTHGGIKSLFTAQDYIDSKISYGVIIGEQYYVLFSDRRISKITNLKDVGLKPNVETVMLSGMSPNAIKEYLEGIGSDNAFELFKDIVRYLRRYLFLVNPEQYLLLASWVMGTYIFRIFTYFPYLHFSGGKGSGKTLAMSLLKEIVFNGQFTTAASPAVLARMTEAASPTWCIDEAEWLGNEHADRNAYLRDVLHSGFQSDGTVTRVAKNDYSKFDISHTYSPKILSSINELQYVLADRAIPVQFHRLSEADRVEKYTKSDSVCNEQQSLRDRLYRFGLEVGPQIGEFYKNNFSQIRGMEHLTGRTQDIWAPIMIVANIVDRGILTDDPKPITNRLRNLSVDYLVSMHDTDIEQDPTVLLAQAILKVIENCPYGWQGIGYSYCYHTEDVYQFLRQEGLIPHNMSKKALSRRLSRLGVDISSRSVRGGAVKYYIFERDAVARIRDRYISRAADDRYLTEVRDRIWINGMPTLDQILDLPSQ